jgi:hypothetical protein
MVHLRNDSPCTTVDTMVDLPDPLPDQVGALVLFVGAVPNATRAQAARLCNEFRNGSASCTGQGCLTALLEQTVGEESAHQMMESLQSFVQAQQNGPPVALPLGTCTTLFNTATGLLGLCAFDPLNPGESDTATYSDTVLGSGISALFAASLAPAEGDDCRPGIETSEGEWLLSGCFPVVPGAATPTLSPYALYSVAAVLLGIGVAGLYRRRRA